MTTFIRLTLVDKLAALNNKPTTLWLVNSTEEYPRNLTVKKTPDEIFHTMEEI
jgi:hypothetical protein